MVIEMVVATSVEVAAVKKAKVATVAPGVKGGGEGGAGGGGNATARLARAKVAWGGLARARARMTWRSGGDGVAA